MVRYRSNQNATSYPPEPNIWFTISIITSITSMDLALEFTRICYEETIMTISCV